MTHSILAQIGGQIRFLSKYFLETETEELVHGADMYANYLNDDSRFVDEVEEKKMTQYFFTVEFTESVFEHFTDDKDKKEEIFKDFMSMLFFDALIGNNDRHTYNWGVIRDISSKKVLKFAPIYDTARGLFWNYNEKQIKNLINDKQFSRKITTYCLNS